MTIALTSSAGKIGKHLATMLHGREDVLSLWARQSGDLSELWLIVDAESIEEEKNMRRKLDQLRERFPEDLCDLRVYDVKVMGTTDPETFVPRDSIRIEI